MFGPGGRVAVEEVKPERVLIDFDLGEKPVSELHPFGVPHLAFEDRFLDPDPEILAGPCHLAESACTRLFHGGDIVGDKDQHGERPEMLAGSISE